MDENVRRNPDGSITVGILTEEKPPKAKEPKAEPIKKPFKKSKAKPVDEIEEIIVDEDGIVID